MKPREPGEQGPASLRGRVHNGVQGGSEQPQEKARTGQKPGSFHNSRDIGPRASPSLPPHAGPEVPLWVLFTSLTEEGVWGGHHAQGQCCGTSSASPWSGPGLLGRPCHFPVLRGGRRWRDRALASAHVCSGLREGLEVWAEEWGRL